MTNISCSNPICFNYDIENVIFCEDCMIYMIKILDLDTLYEIYVKGSETFDKELEYSESLGIVMTPEAKKELKKIKGRWFKVINNIMSKKIKEEK